MKTEDHDKERGQNTSENERNRESRLVTPKTLKLILTIGPWLAKFVRLGIELVKLFKE